MEALEQYVLQHREQLTGSEEAVRIDIGQMMVSKRSQSPQGKREKAVKEHMEVEAKEKKQGAAAAASQQQQEAAP